MLIRSDDAPRFEVPGFEIIGMASPSRGATEICTWRLRGSPEASSPRHRLDREEVFMVLDGRLEVVLSGFSIVLERGDAACVPAGTEFHVRNAGGEAVEAIVCVPAGLNATLADGTELGTPGWAR